MFFPSPERRAWGSMRCLFSSRETLRPAVLLGGAAPIHHALASGARAAIAPSATAIARSSELAQRRASTSTLGRVLSPNAAANSALVPLSGLATITVSPRRSSRTLRSSPHSATCPVSSWPSGMLWAVWLGAIVVQVSVCLVDAHLHVELGRGVRARSTGTLCGVACRGHRCVWASLAPLQEFFSRRVLEQ